MKSTKLWLAYAVTTLFWGILGAFIEIPGRAGFPSTLGYFTVEINFIK